MILDKIHLKEYFPMLPNDIILESYCPDNYNEWSTYDKRKCVLILPGGGYEFLSDRESEPVALKLNGANIACFILKYSIFPNIKLPSPLIDVYAALAYIRRNADKYHIEKDKISVLGFSAGGHLASLASCYHTKKEFADLLNITQEEMKINACLLSYPVISMDFGHEGSIKAITGNNEELKKFLSVDKNITKDFPKTFIWHTTFDTIVKVQNSLALALELEKNKIFFELHIYPMHDHGQALANDAVYNSKNTPNENFLNEIKYNTQWMENCIHFIKEYI